MKNVLPENLKPLFWSYNFKDIDKDKHRKLITVQIINYGTLKEWRWLVDTYGRDSIEKTVAQIQTSELRPGALKLFALLLSLKRFSHAPRGAK